MRSGHGSFDSSREPSYRSATPTACRLLAVRLVARRHRARKMSDLVAVVLRQLEAYSPGSPASWILVSQSHMQVPRNLAPRLKIQLRHGEFGMAIYLEDGKMQPVFSVPYTSPRELYVWCGMTATSGKCLS